MKLFGLHIMTGKRFDKIIKMDMDAAEGMGFQNAVNAVLKIIDNKDKIILGNGTVVIGSEIKAPLTIVGTDTFITWNHFDETRKDGRPYIKQLNKI